MSQPHEIDDEQLRREAINVEVQTYRSMISDRLRFQQEIGMATIKTTTLINGGAIVSLLTFTGNSGQQFDHNLLSGAFACFAVGLTLALLTYFAAYLSQGVLMDHDSSQSWNMQSLLRGREQVYAVEAEKEGVLGKRLIWASIGLLLASLALFVTGAFLALNGIL